MKTKKLISAIFIFAFVFTLMPVMSTQAGGSDDSIRVIVLAELPSAFRDVSYLGEGLFRFTIGNFRNGEEEKCGICDRYGNVALPEEYDSMWWFNEGLLGIRKDGKWGFVDKTCKFVIPMEYDFVFTFSGGVAEVEKDGKRGFIDASGNIVAPLRGWPDWYSYIYDFSEGLALVQTNDGYGFINNKDEIVIKPQYSEASSFSDGLALVKKDGKYGYIDKTGKTVIPFVYDYACSFTDGRAIVASGGERAGSEMQYINCKYGYINTSGDLVVPLEYDYAGYFKEGLAVVGKGGEWVKYSDHKGYAFYQYEGGKYGHIDTIGNIAVPLEHESAGRFSEGLAAAGSYSGMGYIDKTGKVIVPLEYDYTYPMHSFKDGLVPVYKNDKWIILKIFGIGYPIGDVLYSDITAYISRTAFEAGDAIPTSVINGKTLVVVEDLLRYGFDVKWNNNERTLKVELNKSKKITPLPVAKDTTHKPGTFKCKYLYTDIKTYLSGVEVGSYAINGVTLIDFELLKKYGKLTWDGKAREIRLLID